MPSHYTIAITVNEAQLDRIDEMIERFNEGPIAKRGAPMLTREQCIAGGLAALEALLFDNMDGKPTVFAGLR